MLLCPFVVGQWLPQTWMRPVVDHMQYSVLFSHSEGNNKLGYLKDSNAAAHSVDTGIS